MSSEQALRPHHGLCLGFFEGKGYSGEFSRNMASVLSELTPDSPIRLAEGHDVLCAHCPNRFAPCPNAGDYDRRVLELCGLEADTIGALHGKPIPAALDSIHFTLFALYHPASGIYNRALLDVMERDAISLGEHLVKPS